MFPAADGERRKVLLAAALPWSKWLASVAWCVSSWWLLMIESMLSLFFLRLALCSVYICLLISFRGMIVPMGDTIECNFKETYWFSFACFLISLSYSWLSTTWVRKSPRISLWVSIWNSRFAVVLISFVGSLNRTGSIRFFLRLFAFWLKFGDYFLTDERLPRSLTVNMRPEFWLLEEAKFVI